MKSTVNAIPLLIIIVLGVFGVSQTLKGTGNREQGTGSNNSQQRTGNREQGIGTGNSQQCEVVEGSVYDGDTLRVSCNGAIAKIRLACIDAPEAKQEGGIAARDYLRSLINKNGSIVSMSPLEQDRYGRTVAELILKPGSDQEISIQEEMLISGNAMIYESYSDCPNIQAFRLAQEIGQKGRKGVWAESNPEPPWEYRRRIKTGESDRN